jgi:hypothetical protein
MGRRAHQPDPTARRQVEAMAAYGIPETDIATVIGIDPNALLAIALPSLKNPFASFSRLSNEDAPKDRN